jgi:hypothetical protein
MSTGGAAPSPDPARARGMQALRSLWLLALVMLLVAAGVIAAILWSSRSDKRPVAGPIHMHALGVNPDDRRVFIATHTGLFRVTGRRSRPIRVGDSYQDTMGFTVVGPNHFLGSGHPDPRSKLPRLLGLVESRDGGRTWESVSLLGRADFHILRSSGKRIYGFDVARSRLLKSDNGGTSWRIRPAPRRLLDFVVDPRNHRRLVASTPDRLFESRDAAGSWHALNGPAGLLAWSTSGLFVTDSRGGVWMARGPGRPWTPRRPLGGIPAAFTASESDLYAAVHEGSVSRSPDDARSWQRLSS